MKVLSEGFGSTSVDFVSHSLNLLVRSNQRHELCIPQTLMKKVNVSEGGLISYEEFFKSFQKSDAEVSGLRAK